MGDSFEIIADVEATETETTALAATVVRWLINTDIIAAEATDCVLGADLGYGPGPRHALALAEPDDYLSRLRTNGVTVTTGRTAFHPVQGELGPVVCPRCDQTMLLEDAGTGATTKQWEVFSDAIGSWHNGGPGDVACASCGQVGLLNDWRWIGDWPFAFGFLGFTFWNWPRLSDAFVAQVAERLRHRVVVTRGKL
ncbi:MULTISPECIES: hypothetical protein [unclassified Frankia]|uniref:hypothetical protein n=1 Tax=unclassified Frankia TaxID=2632575 RepID=UPI002AD45D85|nr:MULTISPECIES: hypothetical protein [unclassified Frankia]